MSTKQTKIRWRFAFAALCMAHSGTAVDLPSIGVENAGEYVLASVDIPEDERQEEQYVFACIASRVEGKQARAQTMVKAMMELAHNHPDHRILLFLAPHEGLCFEGRLTGTGYLSPQGNGWPAAAPGQWTWNLLTTARKVSDRQVADTIMYESKKDEFRNRYGVYDYHDKLDDFVRSELGREPEYVTSGLWVDTYHVE